MSEDQLPLVWHWDLGEPFNVWFDGQRKRATEPIEYVDEWLVNAGSIVPLNLVWGSKHAITKWRNDWSIGWTLVEIEYLLVYLDRWVLMVAIAMKYISKSLIRSIDILPDKHIELLHCSFDPVESFRHAQRSEVIHKSFLKCNSSHWSVQLKKRRVLRWQRGIVPDQSPFSWHALVESLPINS